MRVHKVIILSLVLLTTVLFSGCGVGSIFDNVSSIVGITDAGTVISGRANIRSSYAVVAADLLEVKRGEKIEILEEFEFEKVKWFRVRANDEDSTEGWIEAQHILSGSLLEKSKALALEDKDLQPQAKAQLKAASNLRLMPDQKLENLLFKLANGSTFDIIGWKYVPKPQDANTSDDPNKKPQPKTKNEEVEAAKEADKPQELDDKYDIWYKVRLDPSVSPAPAGWLFGNQVELDVPSDISFFQIGNTKFIAFQRLDEVVEDEKAVNKDGAKIFKPGSWVVLTRSNEVLSTDGNEPDFDGILILGYDKVNQEYYTAYKKGKVYKRGEVTGNIPMKIANTGDSRIITLNIRDANGQLSEKRFVTSVKEGRLKVTPPSDMSNKDEDEDKK
ncbi:MAG: hypothetical protein MUC29_09015 [Pyrinomonadaceae bacterium]|nr:hypothetical protein [Pyrinomonadaceae bacterium]